MWASPAFNPRICEGISRASMQATTANLRAGGMGSCPELKFLAYS
jgi:hypothetical protein